MASEAAQLEYAQHFIRSHYKGELNFDDHIERLGYVMSPDGRLVAPVMVAMLRGLQTVLSIPDEGEPELTMLLTLEELSEADQRGPLPDRWRIYHGDPPDVNWAFLNIDMARLGEYVLDGDALTLPNPLSDQEASILRSINKSPEVIQRVCHAMLTVDIDAPVAVGVDPSGFDIRGTFEVFRIPAGETLTSPESAIARFTTLDPENG